MEYTNVKIVSDAEEKSVQQVEGELLNKHEQKFEDTQPTDIESVETQTIESEPVDSSLKEEDVLSFMRNR